MSLAQKISEQTDTINNLVDALQQAKDRIVLLRNALHRYASGCNDCRGDNSIDCECGYARAALITDNMLEHPIVIKPCPFCNEPCTIKSDPSSDVYSEGPYRVMCLGTSSHALDEWCDTINEAVESWNQRAKT